MRFLLIVPYTYPDYSGSGINAVHFAGHLNHTGHSATVLSFNRKGKLKSRETRGGVTIRRILYLNKNGLTKLLSLFIIIPSYILNLARNDVILIYGGHVIAFEAAILIGRLLGRKVVFQSLMTGSDDLGTLLNQGNRLLTGIRKRVFKKLTFYHAINPEFTARCPAVLKQKIKILEAVQGVDTTVFRPGADRAPDGIRKELGIGENEFLIVSVGFLIPRKGFGELFKVLSGLQFPFRLVVIGEYRFEDSHFLSGFREEALQIVRQGKELLGDKVIFTGPVDRVAAHLISANVFVLNSRQEGTPNSMLEAMACGVPVVIRRLEGLEEFLIDHEKNGFIHDDEKKLNDILERLYSQPKLRNALGQSARKTIEQKASFDRVLDAYMEFLGSAGPSHGEEN